MRNGNLFIADQGNSKVRVVYAGGAQVAALIAATNGGTVAVPGNIYTILGGGTATYAPGSIVLGDECGDSGSSQDCSRCAGKHLSCR